MIEGAAEFTAELISGGVSGPELRARAEGHEKEIETAFVADADKTDLSQWLYNGTLDKQGDLGYWVGYRIVKSYYEHASDKRQAFREILQTNDPTSGWRRNSETSIRYNPAASPTADSHLGTSLDGDLASPHRRYGNLRYTQFNRNQEAECRRRILQFF